jgi:hypothetical protein
MTIAEIETLVEHLGVAGLAIALWWLERGQRLQLQDRVEKLHDKLDDCFKGKASGD